MTKDQFIEELQWLITEYTYGNDQYEDVEYKNTNKGEESYTFEIKIHKHDNGSS